jgi:glycosyltransferase involved in cell wall biosynthesis
MNLTYLTADEIGKSNHGAGSVTKNELEALKTLGNVDVIDRSVLIGDSYVREEPWVWDERAGFYCEVPKELVHVYAGTFSKCIEHFKNYGSKIVYTAAAHDIELSRKAYETYGLSFNYPHLTDPVQWERYIKGYLMADVVICPSTHSKKIMESYGCKNVVVIPHGIDLPEKVEQLPKQFRVGYLGNCCAPDKGLIYLLQAWKKLNYKDAVLYIGGHDSTSEYFYSLVQKYGGGNIRLLGWVNNVSDFYNNISLYVQPSVTEGFGLEVLEAMAHKRMVICSDGAGASDLLASCDCFPACDSHDLANKIFNAESIFRIDRSSYISDCEDNHEVARNLTWDKIKSKYIEVWKGLLK